MIDDQSAAHAFTRHILTSLSVDKILLPRYVNLSTNFSGLPVKVEIAPCLKHMNFVLCSQRPMPPTYSKLCSRNSTWADVFGRST